MTKLLIASILIFAAACAPSTKSDAVDANGLCTDASISSYNDTRAKILAAIDSQKLVDYQAADAACQNFRKLLDGKSCKATATTSGGDRNMNVDSHANSCEHVSTMIAVYADTNKPGAKNPDNNEVQKPSKKAPGRRSK